ncbi:MAG: class I SAM-dependent methyltransferase [Phycisphaerae bacterium]
MDTGYEKKYHQIEDDYWWFQARRDVILRLLKKMSAPPTPQGTRKERILEVGCSGGPLLTELARRGYDQLAGIDISPDAVAAASERGHKRISVMDAAQLSFADASFDIVIASDILEHLADDAAALREWNRVLAPGGVLIVFVPAYQWLWSGHDVINHHQRRYTASSLKKRLQEVTVPGNGTETGKFEILRLSYWNFGLLLPVGGMRLLKRLLGRAEAHPKDALAPVPGFVNRLLTGGLCLENALLAAGLSYPAGVSVMAVVRKANA